MHTRFSLPVLILIFIIPTFVFASSAGTQADIKRRYNAESKIFFPEFANPGNSPHQMPPSWHKPVLDLPSPAHPEEDGKMHHFHFNRFRKRRYRAYARFFSKILLLVIHVAALVAGYMHCLH